MNLKMCNFQKITNFKFHLKFSITSQFGNLELVPLKKLFVYGKKNALSYLDLSKTCKCLSKPVEAGNDILKLTTHVPVTWTVRAISNNGPENAAKSTTCLSVKIT